MATADFPIDTKSGKRKTESVVCETLAQTENLTRLLSKLEAEARGIHLGRQTGVLEVLAGKGKIGDNNDLTTQLNQRLVTFWASNHAPAHCVILAFREVPAAHRHAEQCGR